MIAVTVLCVFIVAWVIDRAALRRRLDNLERELHALTRSRVQRTGDTPAESPPPAASDLAVPASLPARRESEPTAAPSSNRPTIRVAPQPEKPAPTAGQTPALRLWQLISGGNPIVRFGVIILFFGVAFLLRYASDAGFRCLLVEPDSDRAAGAAMTGFGVLGTVPDDIEGADVVVTDHHRDELGVMLRDALATKARWIGVLGNPHHPGPHIAALEALGVPPGDIARVHRPIGLNIGSRTPPEIAISTLAGLLADHNSRPGGFDF